MLSRADEGFEHRLRLVEAGDWERPTPCPEWDVRALVNHVVGGNVRYVMLLHGAPAAEVDATRTVDHLGHDPVAAFVSTAAAVEAAFAEEGALQRTGHHPAGDRTGAELLDMRVLDVAVHGWDLAVAIGADRAIPPDIVDFLLAVPLRLDSARRRGAFAVPGPESPADRSAQARLLHRLGRQPG